MLIASHVRRRASQYAEGVMHFCRGNLNGNGNGNLNAGTYNGNHNGGSNLVRLVPPHTLLMANSDYNALCTCPAMAHLCCACHAALASSEMPCMQQVQCMAPHPGQRIASLALPEHLRSTYALELLSTPDLASLRSGDIAPRNRG